MTRRSEDVHLSGLQYALYSAMSDLSEDYWAAGWLEDTERDLWRVVNGEELPGWPLTPPEIARLSDLSEAAACWIVWDDGPKAVPLAQWRQQVA